MRPDPKLTVAQVAAVAGVKPSTVRTWIRRRHLTRDRRGRISGVQLLEYLDMRGDRGQHTRA